MPPIQSVAAFLNRLKMAMEAGCVRFTWKAEDEIAELGWSEADAMGELAALHSTDLLRTETSRSADFTLIWVFCPFAADLDCYLWIRLAEQGSGSIVISFHLAGRNPWT
ncbi:MAG TPA: hypothetical protein PKW90_00755 [Myxococcota bacterium]|jgi:plasmid stabilization system protein ParE|nr:hypothetical protein [Myxococcota bacterium]